MGPVNNEGVAAKMDDHVADASGRGGTVAFGGHRRDDAPTRLYYEPTVMARVPDGAAGHPRGDVRADRAGQRLRRRPVAARGGQRQHARA